MKNTATKVTLATVKSFVRNTVGKGLNVKSRSKFDGMEDGVRSVKDTYRPVESAQMSDEQTLGIQGAWFVRDSRDYFTIINTPEWTGVDVYNCCGGFELVVPATSQAASALRLKFNVVIPVAEVK